MNKENNKNTEENIALKDDFFSKIRYNSIVINTEIITLDQFLKFSGITSTGGLAKMIIQDGMVYVNEEICRVRKKKLKKEDRIVFLEDKNNPIGFILKNAEINE